MSLVYLISSLPAIALDSAPPLSYEDFMQRCRDWLNIHECEAVQALLSGSVSGHSFVKAWQDKETILRNAQVQIRARAAGIDASLHTRYAHGCDKKIESDVEDAMQHKNPLQKERDIDKVRWETIEELQGPDPLSIKAVYAYAVKLVIVTRWSRRSIESGKEAFSELTQVPVTL